MKNTVNKKDTNNSKYKIKIFFTKNTKKSRYIYVISAFGCNPNTCGVSTPGKLSMYSIYCSVDAHDGMPYPS